MVATQAAVLRRFGQPQTVEDVVLREPGPGEVLVRIAAAGVCHSDVGQADGEWEHPLPAVLGHEGAGVVEAVGANVDHVAVGQRVVLSLAPGCGGCRHCIVGRPILCQGSLAAMGDGALTTGPTPISIDRIAVSTYSLLGCFANHAVVSERSCIAIPDSIGAEAAALVGCAVITGFGAACHTIDIQAGSRGAVIGVGGVGVNAIQGAVIRGAAEIVAFDSNPSRLTTAVSFGATDSVDVGADRLIESFRSAARHSGFDWAIVTVGAPSAMRLGVDVTRPGGETVLVGLTSQGQSLELDALDIVTYEKRVFGSAYGSLDPRVLIPEIFDLALAGRLKLDELVSDRFELSAINEAFDLSRRAGGLRSVLTMAGQ